MRNRPEAAYPHLFQRGLHEISGPGGLHTELGMAMNISSIADNFLPQQSSLGQKIHTAPSFYSVFSHSIVSAQSFQAKKIFIILAPASIAGDGIPPVTAQGSDRLPHQDFGIAVNDIVF